MDHNAHGMDHMDMHSKMNHSFHDEMPGDMTTAMDHHGDHMNHSMSPSHHAVGNGHGGHSGHGGGMMMYFHFSEQATILFSFWNTDSWGAMLGSCIAIFVLAALYEGLKVLRENLLRRAMVSVRYQTMPVPTNEDATVADTEKSVRSRMLSGAHVIQSLLHILQVIISYFLMLIFMTYNVWLCIAVALGAGTGYFVFGWRRAIVVDVNEHCH